VLSVRSRKQVGIVFQFFDLKSYIVSTNPHLLKLSVIPTDVTSKFWVCFFRSFQVSEAKYYWWSCFI